MCLLGLFDFWKSSTSPSYPESLGRGGEEGCFTCRVSAVCPLPLSLSAKPLGGRKPPSFPRSGSSQRQRQPSPWKINSPKAHAAEDHFAKWSLQQTIIEELFAALVLRRCSPNAYYFIEEQVSFFSTQFPVFSVWGKQHPARPVTLPLERPPLLGATPLA